MNICDGCYARDNIINKSCFVINIGQTHETYHLCNECVEMMKQAIFKPLVESQPEPKEKPVKRGRPKGKH